MKFSDAKRDASTQINFASLEGGASITAVSSNSGGAVNDEAWGANNVIDSNDSNGGNTGLIEFAAYGTPTE